MRKSCPVKNDYLEIKSNIVRKSYLLLVRKERSYPVIEAKEVRTVKEVIRSDGL